MGQKPEEILKDIEQTREALGEKIDVLAGQLREGVAEAKSKGARAAGIAVGVIGALLVIRGIVRRRR